MKNAYTLGAGLAALALTALATAPGAQAADGDEVDVVNTETVQVYVSPDGEIESKRVYEQLTLTGDGRAEIANPIEEAGLRNLNGFSDVSVEDGVQHLEVDVDGVERLRTVSDYEGELPLDISVEYRLDGEPVEPSDVVGADGELEVLYTVRNVTAQEQEVTFPDGTGGTVTETAEVPIPMVGSLTTVAPPNFTEVTSEQANLAGDGKGGTKLSFTMTLFPPLGSDEVQFGYTANVSDAVVPPSSVSALPVNPLESTSFKTAGKSYKSGSETGIKLTEGATEIDGHLLELRDGAAKLLDGLIQLSDGADQLNDGLANEAAPGARELTAGANLLYGGLGQLDDGAGRLADGAGQLSDGVKRLGGGLGDLSGGVDDLDSGAGLLADGQRKLAAGLKKLYDGVDALPASVRRELKKNAEYQLLLGTLTKIVSGIGTDASTGEDTLMGGLFRLRAGLRSPLGLNCNPNAATGAPDACGVGDGVQLMANKFQIGVGTVNTALLPSARGAYAALVQLAGCPAMVAGFPPASVLDLADTNPCKAAAVSVFGYGAPAGSPAPFTDGGIAAQLSTAIVKLTAMKDGIDGRIVPGINRIRGLLYNAGCNPAQTDNTQSDYCGISQAVQLISAGIPTLVDAITGNIRADVLTALGRPTKGCDETETLRCAAKALADGGSRLANGVDELVDGVGLLSEGGAALSAGAGDLAAGAGQLADGTSEARDGSGRLADGAGQLADGLGDAADGSGRLADGLNEAESGAPALVDGAGRLSEEGMSQLIGAGKETARDYGKLYAVIEAGAERADSERMAYGAPEGATGMTAYTYELLGDDGEGGRNTKRGLAAVLLLALGAGAFALRGRFI